MIHISVWVEIIGMGNKSREDQLQYSLHSSGQKYVIKPNSSAKMVATAIEELSFPICRQ